MNPLRDNQPSATPSDILRAITAAGRDCRALQLEVNRLTNVFGKFKDRHELRPYRMFLDPSQLGENGWRGAEAETPEPARQIYAGQYDLPDLDPLDDARKLIRAMAADLDGALRDVRAARLDVKAIKDDPDHRDDYLAWKGGRY